MNALFPFGFPPPTQFYLACYVLTWVLHAVFAGYVVAGTAYLAAASIRGDSADGNPLAERLRDWMPYVLSLAITAGVAPLLFLQVLYQRFHYTANLLLFHRWMAIVPVLIVGFYLLYVLKSGWLAARSVWMRGAVGLLAFACFAFVGWSWTENHLLSLARDRWVDEYASHSLFFRTRQLLPRLCVWFAGAFPVLAVTLGWQLWFDRNGDTPDAPIAGSRRTALLAVVGLVTTMAAAFVYLSVLPQHRLFDTIGLLWMGCGIAGVVAQLVAWTVTYVRRRVAASWLVVSSVGGLMMLIAVAAGREIIRLSAIDVTQLYDRHAAAFAVGGRTTFVVFLLINTALIAYAIRLVRTSLQTAESPADEEYE